MDAFQQAPRRASVSYIAHSSCGYWRACHVTVKAEMASLSARVLLCLRPLLPQPSARGLVENAHMAVIYWSFILGGVRKENWMVCLLFLMVAAEALTPLARVALVAIMAAGSNAELVVISAADSGGTAARGRPSRRR